LVRAVEEQLVEVVLSQVREEAQEAGRALAAEQVGEELVAAQVGEELVAEARVLVPVQERELEQVQVLELVEEAVAEDRARELVVELVLAWVEAEEPGVVGRYYPE
jgi:hypothetical protein